MCLVLMSCATARTVGPDGVAFSNAAQRLADADRVAGSRIEEGEARRAELKKLQGEAADAWLSEELAAIGEDTSDGALHQVQLILAEAKRRERTELAARAEVVRGKIVVSHEPELVTMIAEGRWLAALELSAGRSANAPSDSTAAAVNSRTRDGVKKAIDLAISGASSAPEQYALQRMKSWLGIDLSTGLEFDTMRTLLARAASLSWGSSACAPAQQVTLGRTENGTPLTVTISLGSCEVSMRENFGVPRTGSYSVRVERERDEYYNEDQQVVVNVPRSERVCRQEQITLGTGNQKTSHTVSKCDTKTYDEFHTRTETVTKVRRVKYMADEPRSESFSVDERRYAVSVPVSITITGDGLNITRTFQASDDSLDEQYSRVHGSSRRFQSGIPETLQRGLNNPITSFSNQTIQEWTHLRATTRMARARASASKSEARALAIEAVALDDSVAEAALPLINWRLTAPQLAQLVSGTPAVTLSVLAGGKGLPLPPPSASLEESYSRLEARHLAVTESGNSDLLIGLGAGVLPTPDQKATGAFALEFQYGYVPTFSAISAFLLRIEGDLQLFLTRFLVGDFCLRPEVGVRLGPVSLSAVVAGGGRIAHEQTVIDEEEDGRFSAIGYAGYGPHLSLHLGPVLLDAMLLRLHVAGARSPLATRADALLGVSLGDAVFLFSRLRYLAYSDFLQPQQVINGADRFASLTLGLLLQF